MQRRSSGPSVKLAGVQGGGRDAGPAGVPGARAGRRAPEATGGGCRGSRDPGKLSVKWRGEATLE